ncbi:hypothetical protein ES332_A09G268600v1 [Gossypium tomentosum]|uniref:Uncharacterized protein n=1 Tax=Gossypium tomentosum TaxID=34277 RepID=A0A5D2PBX5_GOSTO|nr:hypothetical protein ES332_A09G268600v1 [Gossypium tomentosum]
MFIHSLLEEFYLILTKFSPQKHSIGSHFLLPSTSTPLHPRSGLPG